jgi:hypothetical protein
MGWENRNGKQYYYLKTRRNGRVISSYCGAGEVARLGARLAEIDSQEREQARAEAQRRQYQLNQLTTTPEQLTNYSAAVRSTVTSVLEALGFHQHKRQWRYTRMTAAIEPNRQRAVELFKRRTLADNERRELRNLLDAEPTLIRSWGSMAHATWVAFTDPLATSAGWMTAVEERANQIRHELGWSQSSELERMLIEEVVLTNFDYYRIERCYAKDTGDTFSGDALEQWDRILTSKQKRYLRAIEALARVRRLLKLPVVQVNIAQPGSQQLNVAGELITPAPAWQPG